MLTGVTREIVFSENCWRNAHCFRVDGASGFALSSLDMEAGGGGERICVICCWNLRILEGSVCYSSLFIPYHHFSLPVLVGLSVRSLFLHFDVIALPSLLRSPVMAAGLVSEHRGLRNAQGTFKGKSRIWSLFPQFLGCSEVRK